jgi:hypothetical protein
MDEDGKWNFSGSAMDFSGICDDKCESGRCAESFATLRLAKVCAVKSFGEEALLGDWRNVKKNHAACSDWFNSVKDMRVLDSGGRVIRIDYKLEGHPVCCGAWGGFMGIRPATLTTIDRKVRDGAEVWNDGLRKAAAIAARSLRAMLTTQATEWWCHRLLFYEMVVSRGYISHPRDMCMKDIYNDEFRTDMAARGTSWKRFGPPDGLADGSSVIDNDALAEDALFQEEIAEDEMPALLAHEGTRTTWYRGLRLALGELAKEYINGDAPPFKFVARAKHAAYVRLTIAHAVLGFRGHILTTNASPCCSERMLGVPEASIGGRRRNQQQDGPR